VSAAKFATVETREVGSRFGCCGIVKSANGRTVAETRVFPYGHDSSAFEAARDLATSKGYTVRDENDDA
jgi:hypothetical protein